MITTRIMVGWQLGSMISRMITRIIIKKTTWCRRTVWCVMTDRTCYDRRTWCRDGSRRTGCRWWTFRKTFSMIIRMNTSKTFSMITRMNNSKMSARTSKKISRRFIGSSVG